MEFSKTIKNSKLEEPFAGLSETSQTAIISFDEKQNILLLNNRAEILFGYSSNQLVGESLNSIFPDGFKESFYKVVDDFKNSSKMFLRLGKKPNLIYCINKNGEKFQVEIIMSKFNNNEKFIFVSFFHETPSQETILIIDDDKFVVESICDSLRRENYNIIAAANGIEGLEIIKKENPILIILDLKMPIMNGMSFLDELKISESDPYVVIILSAHGDNEDIKNSFELGAVSYLRKPYNIYELTGLVKNTIAAKQAQLDFENIVKQLVIEQNRVKVLRGYIPICASCKKIRDDKGFWQGVEYYVSRHSEADFTHSICPECSDRLYPELKNFKKAPKN